MNSAAPSSNPRRPQRRPHPTGFAIDPVAPEPRRAPQPSPAPACEHGGQPTWRRAIMRIVGFIVVAINSLAAIGLLVSAYSQRISPEAWPTASIIAMSFGFWLLGVIVLFAADLRWWRRAAWIPGLAMLACVSQIDSFMPLNLPHMRMSQAEKEKSFSLLTYNVAAWNDNQGKDAGYNRQMDFILKQNADIVCVQEARFLAPTAENKIKQAQIDSMHTAYPYIMTQGSDFAILSKYPVEPINLDFPSAEFDSGGMAAWRTRIDGRVVNIFSVHLRSFGLSDDDKGKYEDIVKLDARTRGELSEAKASILPKVAHAGVQRTQQIAYLQKYLQRYGGKNAIVAGDFNDTENCYGIYRLCADSRMRQAYEYAGFGPAHTFNANLLFFRIDHILYRGEMKPYSIRRFSTKASDHYPLKATFIMD